MGAATEAILSTPWHSPVLVEEGPGHPQQVWEGARARSYQSS